MGTVTIGGESIAVGLFSGRKAITGERIIRRAVAQYPQILEKYAAWRRRFETEGAMVLPRAEAVYRFGERASALSADDWAESGQELRLAKAPNMGETIAALWPVVMDAAEDEVLRLLALCVIPSDELREAKRNGGHEAVDAALLERGEDLLDEAADMTDLLELGVVAAEALRDQFAAKGVRLGERLGALVTEVLASLGFRRRAPLRPSSTPESTPQDGSAAEKPTSSTSSPADTAGDPTGS